MIWNDAGESHYIGNNWPEVISSSPAIWQMYSHRNDHTMWQAGLALFIGAYQTGVMSAEKITLFSVFAGAFWY